MATSKLAKIELPKNWGPFDLLKNWIDDFKKQTHATHVGFSLATASKLGQVRNRFINLQELTEDGLLFNTNPTSPKAKHIDENPNVAVSFFFVHVTPSGTFSRQVCIEGVAEKVPMTEEQYRNLPFFAQMRSALIREQSVEVNWDDLKRRHDELLKKIQAGTVKLDCLPDNLVLFKITPKVFDFYYGPSNEIADRILFRAQGGTWTCNHITA